MSEHTETETTTEISEAAPDATEVHDEPQSGPDTEVDSTPEAEETFPRSVVEQLRRENAKYRTRAQSADDLAHRLHTELVRATGRLADPTDLEFHEDHLGDPDALAAAVDELLTAKPHLASRRPVGDAGQGNRGGTSEPFSLLGKLKGMV